MSSSTPDSRQSSRKKSSKNNTTDPSPKESNMRNFVGESYSRIGGGVYGGDAAGEPPSPYRHRNVAFDEEIEEELMRSPVAPLNGDEPRQDKGSSGLKRSFAEMEDDYLPIRERRHFKVQESKCSSITTSQVAWSEETHRAFVEAIYGVGVKQASPAVILEHMTEIDPAVTSERVKSRLQKYRNNKAKSKAEFMAEYDSWMQKALTVGAVGGGGSNRAMSRLASPSAIAEMMGLQSLLGGDVAAFLSYSVLADESDTSLAASGGDSPTDVIRSGSEEYAKYFTGARIPFPVLTEDERKSPLGVSISHVISLFYSMTQCVMKERQTREENASSRMGPKEEMDGCGTSPFVPSRSSNVQDNDTSHPNPNLRTSPALLGIEKASAYPRYFPNTVTLDRPMKQRSRNDNLMQAVNYNQYTRTGDASTEGKHRKGV